MDIIEQPKSPGAPVGLAKWKCTSAATATDQVQTPCVTAVAVGSVSSARDITESAVVEVEAQNEDEERRMEA